MDTDQDIVPVTGWHPEPPAPRRRRPPRINRPRPPVEIDFEEPPPLPNSRLTPHVAPPPPTPQARPVDPRPMMWNQQPYVPRSPLKAVAIGGGVITLIGIGVAFSVYRSIAKSRHPPPGPEGAEQSDPRSWIEWSLSILDVVRMVITALMIAAGLPRLLRNCSRDLAALLSPMPTCRLLLHNTLLRTLWSWAAVLALPTMSSLMLKAIVPTCRPEWNPHTHLPVKNRAGIHALVRILWDWSVSSGQISLGLVKAHGIVETLGQFVGFALATVAWVVCEALLGPCRVVTGMWSVAMVVLPTLCLAFVLRGWEDWAMMTFNKRMDTFAFGVLYTVVLWTVWRLPYRDLCEDSVCW